MNAASKVSGVTAGLILLLMGAAIVWAQAPPTGDDVSGAITVDVRRVVLYVTVREGRVGFVGDLRKEDFTVKEDGVPREILQFSRDDVPVAAPCDIGNFLLDQRKDVLVQREGRLVQPPQGRCPHQAGELQEYLVHVLSEGHIGA